jgi:hypothetical protein
VAYRGGWTSPGVPSVVGDDFVEPPLSLPLPIHIIMVIQHYLPLTPLSPLTSTNHFYFNPYINITVLPTIVFLNPDISFKEIRHLLIIIVALLGIFYVHIPSGVRTGFQEPPCIPLNLIFKCYIFPSLVCLTVSQL